MKFVLNRGHGTRIVPDCEHRWPSDNRKEFVRHMRTMGDKDAIRNRICLLFGDKRGLIARVHRKLDWLWIDDG